MRTATVFRLNTHTASDQRWPEIAVSDDGRVIAAGWASLGQHRRAWSVVGQRFDAGGHRLGGEFALDDFRGDKWPNAEDPSIDFDGQGNFAVAWHSRRTDSDDGGWTIWVRRYHADGSPEGPGKLVPTRTQCDQWRPTVLVAANGDTLVTWYSDRTCGSSVEPTSDIRGRMLDKRGAFKGDEFQISDEGPQRRLQWRAGACNRNGLFASYWYVEKPALRSFARVLNPRGEPLGPVMSFPDWAIFGIRGDGMWLGVSGGQGLWYTPSGKRIGPAFSVTGSELAMNDAGYFVTLRKEKGAAGHGLYAYPYDATGRSVGDPIYLTPGHSNIGERPLVDMSENGVIVAAWEEADSTEGGGFDVWGAVARHPLGWKEP